MWRDNLLEIIEEKKMKPLQIAEGGNLPLKTVLRVIKGKTQFPTIDTLDRFATALGCSLGDILAGTRVVVGDHTMIELEEKLAEMEAEKDTILAENKITLAENALLKTEVQALNAKIELLSMQLTYKDEIIALHKIIEQERNK